jgi:excisionase family DNA binding protein
MTQMMTVGQAAYALRLSRSGIRWLFDTGRLRGHRAGRYRLIPVDEVHRLERRRAKLTHKQTRSAWSSRIGNV